MERILIGYLSNHAGGVERYILDLAGELQDEFLFDFLTSEPDLTIAPVLEARGSKIYRIPTLWRPLRQYRAMKRIVAENSYSCVHFNISTAMMAAPVIACRHMKIKGILVHSHSSGVDRNSALQRAIYRFLHSICKPIISRYANSFAACSTEAAKWMFTRAIYRRKQYRIFPNTIDTGRFSYDPIVRMNVRKRLQIDDRFVVGHIGSFTYTKNHSFLIQIFDELRKQRDNAVLLLVGTGILQDEIKQLVHQKGLDDYVIFAGRQEETSEYYQAMDVFVLPSVFEGFPIVGVEAQTAGLPCFFSDSITRDVALTRLAHFLNLSAPPSDWISAMNGLEKNTRRSYKDEVDRAGYSNQARQDQMRQYYLQYMEKVIL